VPPGVYDRPMPVRAEAEQVEFADLVLRAWLPADAGAIMRAADDPLIRLWNPLTPDASSLSLEAALAWCDLRADWSEGNHASWAIALAETPGEAIGSVSLFHVDEDQACCEGGYWLAEGSRGSGVAGRALKAAVRYAFDRLALHRVEIFHSVENVASCKTAERASLRLEGLHRQSHRYGDGRFHDEHCHAVLVEDLS
jgi:RimJ/RimL family protein N-acetyltransferase